MNSEPSVVAPSFRFGLRSMLLVVTGFCVVAGMFWFVSLVLLLLMSALLAQLIFFMIFQRFVNWIAGEPDRQDATRE